MGAVGESSFISWMLKGSNCSAVFLRISSISLFRAVGDFSGLDILDMLKRPFITDSRCCEVAFSLESWLLNSPEWVHSFAFSSSLRRMSVHIFIPDRGLFKWWAMPLERCPIVDILWECSCCISFIL